MKYASDIVTVNDGKVNYETHINAEGHVIIADEPLDKGGQNKGPTAHQLLLAALGSCTAVTLRMYSARKGWAFDQIKVSLNMDKVEVNGETVTKIFRKIEFHPQPDEKTLERLMIIADKCPVHKTITGTLEITGFPQ